MKFPERYVHYQIGEIDNAISVHIGRGYFKDNGEYKETLSVPVDSLCDSDELYSQISRFKSIYAIDTNKLDFQGFSLVASCSAHLCLEYEGNNCWKHMLLTRLPVVISLASEENPEVFAWKRIIEALSPKVQGSMALIVDSELGYLPLFNARKKPICKDYILPENVQLIYASAERDLLSPLNKAINLCDKDATTILTIIAKKCDVEIVRSNILSSTNACIYIYPPTY